MNPFVNIPDLPHFAAMTPELADQALKELLQETRAKFIAFEAEHTPTWEGFLRPLYEITTPLSEAWGLLTHLLSVMNSDAWRQVHAALQPAIVELTLLIGQSHKNYTTLNAIKDNDQAQKLLTPIQRRFLDKCLLEAQLCGVGLPPEQQTRFNQIQTRLAQLATTFGNNLLDATKAFAITLHSSVESAGLPDDLLAITAQAAREHGHPTATPAQGPWRITLDTAVYIPFMTHSKNRAAREQLHRAFITRAAQGELDNNAHIEEILALRRELSSLLGFPHYAALSLASKTAKNVKAVDHLTAQLDAASQTLAHQEQEELTAFARTSGFDAANLQPWDIAFWAERQLEHRYAYNEEEVRRYFPFPRVLEGLFALAEKLFAIKILAADGEASLWHPDVRFFRVYDLHNTPLAAFYLDPYSRPATKRGGAWMNSFKTRDRRPDGTLQLPLAVLVCNQSVPVGDAPTTMRFQEVLTLFHEFGHALQHMLTTIEDPHVSGLNCVEWDAVEIASQFMENWCYHRATLQGLSQHIETQARLPDELFDKLVASKNYRAANALRRQLYLGNTDMDLHARYKVADANTLTDVKAVQNHNAQRFLTTQPLPEDNFLCGFSHIFGGGYAAGYYSYKWSEVLSADIFAAFEEHGLDDANIRTTGLRLRDTLMALGGSIDPMEMFQQFRGRTPSIEPLLRQNGLLT